MIGTRDELTFASVAGEAPRSNVAKAASAAVGVTLLALGCLTVAAGSGGGLLLAGAGVALFACLAAEAR